MYGLEVKKDIVKEIMMGYKVRVLWDMGIMTYKIFDNFFYKFLIL